MRDILADDRCKVLHVLAFITSGDLGNLCSHYVLYRFTFLISMSKYVIIVLICKTFRNVTTGTYETYRHFIALHAGI
jgi:hypothetical protein